MAYVPPISNDFVLIMDWSKPDLATVILSYIIKQGQYTPVFAFPTATVAKSAYKDDEHKLTRVIAPQFDVLTHNAIARIKGCENLILAGISDEQKSYLSYLGDYNVLEIPTMDDVDFMLSTFQGGIEYLPCRSADLANGLLQAADTGLRLRIDETAETIPCRPPAQRDTILVVEKRETVSMAIALNYAVAINADVVIVDPLVDGREYEIKTYIEDWKIRGSAHAYRELTEAVTSRVWEIDFTRYAYATFFTTGLPYSLILKDPIPMTYVHLFRRPDFFIFDNIFFERQESIGGAVVFSPQLFNDEETTQVIETLERNNYYVSKLVGQEATAYNIEMEVREFPFDLLHFCSHGGKIAGISVVGDFVDRDGNRHAYEYDEVITFAPEPGYDEVTVVHKRFTRKFDGLIWRGPELRSKNYPRHVWEDMDQAIEKADEEKTTNFTRNESISGSCAIECVAFAYQAMFNKVAGGTMAPLVFNNTCWSWSDIADCFLDSGSRGYIGTLWNVDNREARETARAFYRHILDMTISEALHLASAANTGTNSEYIYVYWGLPFSTFKPARSLTHSREEITRRLLMAFYHWYGEEPKETRAEIKKNMRKMIRWMISQLFRNFQFEYLKLRARRK